MKLNRHLGQPCQYLVFCMLLVSFLRLSGAPAVPSTRVRLLTDWYPDPERGGYYFAKLNGYYRDAGLDVEIIPGGPNTMAVQRLLTGRIEFTLGTSGDAVIQAAKGLPLVIVAATMQHDPQAILVHESSPVHRFEDLEGRTVAVTPGALWIQYVRKRYHLTHLSEKPATLSIANFVNDTNEVLQCFVTSEPFFAREAGIRTRTLPIEDDRYQPYRVLITSRPYLTEHPDVVKAFVQATLRGWKDYLSNPNGLHSELQRLNPELSPSKMEFSWKALRDGHFVLGNPIRGEVHGAFDDRRLRAESDILKELGLLNATFDYRRAFDPRFCNPKP